MRRHVRWIAAAVALVVTPAVIGVILVAGGDDRRLGAATAERSASTASHVALSLGKTETTWRAFSWGADLDVVEYRTADEAGGTDTRLVPGKSKLRAITVERGFAAGGDSAEFIRALRAGDRFDRAELRVLDTNGAPIASYELSRVLIAAIEHELVAGQPFLERLTLRYEDLAFS